MKKLKYLSLIMLMALMLTGCGKSSKNVAEQYCNILVKGNYGDILDIAYFPKSDLITKDKIKEAKQKYYEEMSKNNNNITSCEASQTNEDDKKIYYKLVKNGADTENIEVDKETNKIVIKDLYVNSEIKVKDNTTVYVDGIELKEPQKQALAEPGKTLADFEYYQDSYNNYLKQLKESVYVYKISILKHADYKVKYTHTFFKDKEDTLCKEEECINSQYFDGLYMEEKDIKDQELVNSLKNMFTEIALVGFEGKDRNSISQYFNNSDSMSYIDIFKKERTDGKGNDARTFIYKKLNDEDTIKITSVYYNAEDEIKLRVQVNYIADTNRKFGVTQDDKTGVDVTITLKHKNNWQIVSFEDVDYYSYG